jgi:hypothetical protein
MSNAYIQHTTANTCAFIMLVYLQHYCTCNPCLHAKSALTSSVYMQSIDVLVICFVHTASTQHEWFNTLITSVAGLYSMTDVVDIQSIC